MLKLYSGMSDQEVQEYLDINLNENTTELKNMLRRISKDQNVSEIKNMLGPNLISIGDKELSDKTQDHSVMDIEQSCDRMFNHL